MKTSKTTVGVVDAEALSFTVGKDLQTDLLLAEWDCIGSAAHVTMLSRMRVSPPLITARERAKILKELLAIMETVRRGRFSISVRDQDVHMAVERLLTGKLGDLGRKVHTGRSRNDQVAVDLRLYARAGLLDTIDLAAGLAGSLLKSAARHKNVFMAGRTHLQPAMPSTVGLWASAYAESLLDDLSLLVGAYRLNDCSPLGAAAGYGVRLPLDRKLTARLLGFSRAHYNVIHAINARGKCESAILSAMTQVMLTLSRLSTDLILFSMPEFAYFVLPERYCTGSSIMPQKRNPDVLELVRAKAAGVMARAFQVCEVVRGLPCGYNRDLQETKLPFVEGIAETQASLKMLTRIVQGMEIDRGKLAAGLTPGILAADLALEMAASGVPFRTAYDNVKKNLGELRSKHAGTPAPGRSGFGARGGLDIGAISKDVAAVAAFAAAERRRCSKAISGLLGQTWRM